MPDSSDRSGHLEAHVGAAFIPTQFEEHALEEERRRERRGFVVLGLVVFALAAVLVEPLVVRSALITPLNGFIIWPMRVLGLIAGIGFAFATFHPEQTGWKQQLNKVAKLLVFCGLGLASFDALTWRTARWIEFGYSTAGFAPQTYPLTTTSDGRLIHKGRVRIDPFDTGQPLVIYLPPDQLDTWQWPPNKLCITVMQRRSPSGAIEVQTEPWRPFGSPAAKAIKPCLAAEPDQRNSLPAA
ncbi:MAG: hypothetical protein ACKOPM_15260 [Novosphingobium sp.]